MTKYTIVFFLLDAWGHIQPTLSIIKELQRRGHKVVLLTHKPIGAAHKLRSQGLLVDSCLPPTESEKDIREGFVKHVERFRLSIEDAYAETYKVGGVVYDCFKTSTELHNIAEAKLKALQPDLIVYDHVTGSPLVYLARRWVRIYSGFPSVLYSGVNDNFVAGLGLKVEEMHKWVNFEREIKTPMRQKVVEYFMEHGAPEWSSEFELQPTSPYLNFYFGPQELGLEKLTTEGNRDQKKIEKKIWSIKPLSEVWFRLEHTIDEEMVGEDGLDIPEGFTRLPGKIIYFSLGTLASHDIYLLNRLLEIMSKSEHKFIVSMGPFFDKIPLYSNMWGNKFVNQRAVLRIADLFITHGGHNSIIEAFFFGVPGLIVMPVFADQFDMAQQVESCGFGVRLDPYKCTEAELLKAIDSMLENKEVESLMKIASSRMMAFKYHKIAADKLENLIASSQDQIAPELAVST